MGGIVEQLGDSVRSVSVGDEVFGQLPPFEATVHAGAWAELIAVPEAFLTRKPDGIDTATAGAMGVVVCAALMCLDALRLSADDTVLVIGASGGVGTIIVQLAARAGATVIAPGPPEDEDYLRGLGANELLARDSDVVAIVRERHPDGVDAIVDLVSHALGAYDAALKDGTRIASTNYAAGEGAGRTNVTGAPSPDILKRADEHVIEGIVKVPIQRTYDLVQAPEGMRTLYANHTRGKLALRVG